MNALCYKIVFSKRLGAMVAVGEHTSGQGKAAGTGVRTVFYPSSAVGASANGFVGVLKSLCASAALTCFTATVAAAPDVNTLPTGYSINSGNVSVSTAGANMTIKQSTDKASVNWQSFSIGSAASVNIQQNSASSVLLNRVVGNDPSQIFGKLTANGQVILINPNGVVFGKGGSVTASAFTASTFGMTEDDFNKGKRKFSRNGSTASVTVEEGASINTTTPGGYIALIAATVNNQGSISAKQGSVVLAAAETVTLPSALTDNVGIPLSSKVRLELTPSTINASVENGGTITTEGGQVLMQAAAVVDAVSHIANANVTNTGTIDTTGEQGGRVDLLANHGTVRVRGTVKANSTNGTAGGSVFIGRDEDTNTLAAVGDASGARIESKGGFVETSGEFIKVDGARVLAKDWLLDPFNITIVDDSGSTTAGATPLPSYTSNATSTIKASDIVGTLTDGTSVTISTAGSGNDAGDITVNANANIIKTSSGTASLTLRADRNITVNAKIGAERDAAGLNINLQAGQNTNTGGITIAPSGSLDAKGGDIKLQTQGGTINVNSTAVVKGNNIAIDNSGGTIADDFSSISQGGKTSSSATGVALNGGGVQATNKLSILGVSSFGWGLSSSAALIEGKTLDITGRTSGNNALRLNGGTTIRALANGGISTLAGYSAGGIGSGGSGASYILGSNNFDAKEGSTLNIEGHATSSSTNFRANMRGLRLESGTNTTDGVVTFRGVSKNSDGLLLIQNQLVKANSGTLTLEGTTQATGNASSQSGFSTYGSGSIQALNNSNLIIKGTAANANGTMDETGAYLGFSITGSTGSTLKVIGDSTSANNSSGIVMNAAVSGFKEVTMLGSRPATSTGSAVLINNNLTANGNVLIQANGGQITQTNYTLSSTNGWITIDNSNSQNVNPSTGKVNEKGAATAQVNAITLSGGVSAGTNNGTDKKDLNIYGQGSAAGVVIASGRLSASGNVNITGEGVNERGVLTYESITNVKPSIEAKNGDVNITGKSTNQTAISLESAEGLVKAKNNIVIAGDKQNLSTLINAGSSVKLQTATPGGSITLGADDGSAQLGISQAELTKITANKLIIGSSTDGGSINVASAIDVKHIDTLSLQTQSTNTVTQTNSGSIKGNKVEIVSGNVTLNNAANNITTLAAKAATLNFVNNAALTIGEVNGTKGITTTGGSSVITRTGNLTINENVSNNGAGDVILGAGTDASANEGLDSNIKVGNTAAKVSNTSTGKTFLYTGSTSDTNKLEDLNSSLANLDLSAIDGSKQNADSNVTFKTDDKRNIIEDGADVQVMFREKIKIGSLTGVEVSKTYGYANTKDTAQAALLVDTKTTLKGVNQGNSEVTEKSAGKIRIANAALIDTLNGSLTTQSTDFSTSKFLKANETNVYKYGALTSNKYDTSLTADQVTVKVSRKEVTYSGVSVISKEYDGSTTANLNGKPTLGTVDAGSGQANDRKVIAGDKVKLSDAVSATYESSNVIGAAGQNGRNDITLSGVTLTADIDSSDSGNYKLIQLPLVGAGTITAKTLTLSGTTVADKPFDGNTSATVTNNGTLNGLVGNETLSVTATGTFNNSSVGNQKPVAIKGALANGTGLASNYRVAPASTVANITEAVKPPVPVVPTDGNSRVKVPVGSANPFALASAEDLADDTCSANSIENCHCEASPLNANVDICYEPKASAKGSAR